MCPPTSYYNLFPLDYRLLCPSSNQVLRLDQYWCNGSKFFDQKDETWLWNVFASRKLNVQRIQFFRPRARLSGKLSLLERLPGELIEEILDIILSDEDRPAAVKTTLLFGLSSNRLWSVVLRRIHGEYQCGLTNNWAGRRVGFHGSFSYPTTSQIETYSIENSIFRTSPWRHWYLSPYFGLPEEEWRKSATEIQAVCSEFCASEWEQIHQDLSQAYLYPQDQVWVLRNITTSQFVRSDKLRYPGGVLASSIEKDAVVEESAPRRLNISKLWKTVTGKGKEIVSTSASKKNDGYKPLTLAQVFLVLTCFSDISNIPYQELVLDFQQGPWTGHAFDLVTLEEHDANRATTVEQHTDDVELHGNAETGVSEWTDVSESVAADVGSVRRFMLDTRDKHIGLRRPVEDVYWLSVRETRKRDRAWTGLAHV